MTEREAPPRSHAPRARVHRALKLGAAVLLAALAVRLVWDPDEPAPAGAAGTGLAPTVVLVLVDEVDRARTSAYGAGRQTTPALARLAAEGLRAGGALAASTAPAASVASILTGRPVHAHGLTSLRDPGRHGLPAAEETLAEHLRALGYRTLAAVSLRQMAGRITGFDQGFEVYRDDHVPASGRPVPAAATLEALRPELEAALAGQEPVFALLHLADLREPGLGDPPELEAYLRASLRPHAGRVPGLAEALSDLELQPGEPLAELRRLLGRRRGSAELAALDGALHDATLRELDRCLEALLELLEEHGRLGDAVVAVAGTTGTPGTIGSQDAGGFPGPLAVPLVLRLPGGPGPCLLYTSPSPRDS